MKILIKLLIVAAIVNGAFRWGSAAWTFYQLQDFTQELITFSQGTPAAIHDRILEKAVELQLPLQSENIEVQRENRRTTAVASYVQPVELFPNYVYRWPRSFSVEATQP